MTDRVAELTREALSLPISDRVEIAQMLWRSVQDLDSETPVDPALLKEIRRRNAELSNGTAHGRTHDEVMESMLRAIECS